MTKTLQLLETDSGRAPFSELENPLHRQTVSDATNKRRPEQHSRHLEHILERPVVGPARVDLVAQVLVANIRGQSQAPRAVLVGGRGVNRVRAVQHDVSRRVIGDQPARIKTIGDTGQVLRDPALARHVLVEGLEAILRRQFQVALPELRFEFSALLVGSLEVRQPAHLDRNVTDGNPDGAEVVRITAWFVARVSSRALGSDGMQARSRYGSMKA